MLTRWFSPIEIVHLVQRIRADRLFRRKLLTKLHLAANARIEASWAHTESPPTGWWNIPAIQTRWNTMISGNEAVTHQEYVTQKYFRDRDSLIGLSLGCGTGGKEASWARTGKFRSIDAYDLSPQRILAAIESTRDTPEAKIITYRAADINNLELPNSAYDVVIFEHSLHHFSPLDSLLRSIAQTLKPGGLVVANEFVGPTRFQWTDRQLAVINALLEVFPREHRTLFGTSFPKQRVIRPGKLHMWLSDPSEAIESSRILPLLAAHFDVLETRGYGGAILHLLFSEIAHHFVSPDSIGKQLLKISFAVEDALLDCGDIAHDFAVIVCRKEAHTPV